MVTQFSMETYSFVLASCKGSFCNIQI